MFLENNMIFCTIGTQASFDRFVKIIDEVASEIDEEIIVQAIKCNYKPTTVKLVGFLSPDNYNEIFRSARLIVAHAGMGTIISAMHQSKSIIIFPRIAKLGEHRNEHQLATAEKMKALGYVYVAQNANELKLLLKKGDLKPLHKINNYANESLINEISRIIG